MENRKKEYRKYALYTFLTLMIELSIASLMYLLVAQSQMIYISISTVLWECGIFIIALVTAALFFYFIIKWYCEEDKTHEESDTGERAEQIPPSLLQ